MLAVTHELHAAQDRRARGGGTALHDVRPGIVEVQRADGHDAALGLIRLEESHEQAREALELRAFGVGAAALGDLARRARNGGRRRLEHLRPARWGSGGAPRALQLADRALDTLEQ